MYRKLHLYSKSNKAAISPPVNGMLNHEADKKVDVFKFHQLNAVLLSN